MGHPNGGKGNTFKTNHTYEEAYQYVRSNSVSFLSTTDERIIAKAGYTKDKTTKTIVFMGERNRHGSTCKECWGHRKACDGSRIGQCSEALDKSF